MFLSLVAFLFFVDFDKSYSLGFAFFFNDFFKFFFQAILFCSVICFFYVSKEFVEIKKILSFEYDLIICFSLFGLILVNVCDDFLTLYLSIELQSLAFYTLAAFNRKSEYSAEASVKYFILGGFSSGLLLLGFALLYASFGSTNFEAIERTNFLIHSLMVLSGCCFISVSILFKLGTFPFHNWLCDVYDGSITNVTAFFSVIPKVILLGFFIRVFFVVFSKNSDFLVYLLIFSGLGSICFASVCALYQKRIKRLMAYSTVSHTGFIILGFCCFSSDSVKACIIYISIYIVMTLMLFSFLFVSSRENNQQKHIINWTALFERNISAALAFALLLCSTAGIPPLAGFYSKLSILFCLLSKSQFSLVVVIAVFSSIGCFYYIRLVKIFFFAATNSTTFWFGRGTKNVEYFMAQALIFIVFFLARPSCLINTAMIAALSLTR